MMNAAATANQRTAADEVRSGYPCENRARIWRADPPLVAPPRGPDRGAV